MRSIVPVLSVVGLILSVWYLAAIPMNADWARAQAERAEVELGPRELVAATWSQDKPRLPAPHQVAVEIWETTAEKKITSKRSLIYHSWITLSATLMGFAFGTILGILLAV
ncbi:MAG: ABC transporter permease, partial [Pseudomonadota bacterium]